MKYTYFRFLNAILVSLISVGTSSVSIASHVEYIWSGALTSNSIRVTAKISEAASVRLQVSTDEQNYANPIYSNTYFSKGQDDYFVSMDLDGLQENTTYFYRVEINGTIDQSTKARGRFYTPASGPFSFKFALGSCMGGGSNRRVFETIGNQDILFFMNTGDMHYRNIASNCETNFQGAFRDILGSETQSALYRKVPISYMWDDHDYGPNDSDVSAPCREIARASYQRHVPHYPLVYGQGNVPVTQSFVIGRLRFLLTDLRSEKRKPVFKPSSCDKAQLGTNFGFQLAWFKSELLAAKEAGQLAVWVTGIPYINGPGGPNYHCKEADNWGGYMEERVEIADYIKAYDIPTIILAGDSHMTAIDDGRNSDYASGGGAPIPVFHAGSLDRGGSYKGGPYSHGYKKAGGQFGLVEVIDDGSSVLQMSWKGMSEDNYVLTSENLGTPLSYDFSINLGAGSIFPVNFVAVDIKEEQNRVVLSWKTAQELNLSHYTIERSIDQQVYEDIGRLSPGLNDYTFRDDIPVAGRWYYRLKAVDIDGSLTFSEVKSIEISLGELEMTVFPNPSFGELSLDIYGQGDRVELQVFDMQGKEIVNKLIELINHRAEAAVDLSNFPPQMYFLRLSEGNNWQSKRVLVLPQ